MLIRRSSLRAATGLLAVFALATPTGGAATLPCSASATLEGLVGCIEAQMPRAGQGFAVPDAAAQSDWASVIRQMLEGGCAGIALPARLAAAFEIRVFRDADTHLDSCVLMETRDADGDGRVDLGWGTFIVDPAARRELHVEIPHPIADAATGAEGIGVFKGVRARSFLMAGAHRDASADPSGCQADAPVSDAAHCTQTMFQPAVAESWAWAKAAGKPYTVLQFHGMAGTSCPGVDVFMTYGVETAPKTGSKLASLRTNLAKDQPAWAVRLPGDGSGCALYGTTGVQGRLLNGVGAADVCATSAPSASGLFIHVEQKPGVRSSGDWIHAIQATWPEPRHKA